MANDKDMSLKNSSAVPCVSVGNVSQSVVALVSQLPKDGDYVANDISVDLLGQGVANGLGINNSVTETFVTAQDLHSINSAASKGDDRICVNPTVSQAMSTLLSNFPACKCTMTGSVNRTSNSVSGPAVSHSIFGNSVIGLLIRLLHQFIIWVFLMYLIWVFQVLLIWFWVPQFQGMILAN